MKWLGAALLVAWLGCDSNLEFGAAEALEARARDAGPARAIDGPLTPGGCTAQHTCGPSALHCSLPTLQCVECLDDSDCRSALEPWCDPSSHQCVECSKTAQCPLLDVCLSTTHQCVRVCFDRDDCSPVADIACLEGLCVECLDDSQCSNRGPRASCERSSGRCVACVSSAQCSGVTPVCDLTSGQCVGCLSSSECPESRPYCDPLTNTCA